MACDYNNYKGLKKSFIQTETYLEEFNEVIFDIRVTVFMLSRIMPSRG